MDLAELGAQLLELGLEELELGARLLVDLGAVGRDQSVRDLVGKPGGRGWRRSVREDLELSGRPRRGHPDLTGERRHAAASPLAGADGLQDLAAGPQGDEALGEELVGLHRDIVCSRRKRAG